MGGKPPVAGFQNARDAWQLCRCMERPSPPDLAGEKDDGSGAAVDISISRSDAHFPQQIFRWQVEKSLHARVLQSRETETAFFERAKEPAGKRSADGAIAVEKEPAAKGVTSFRISHF